MLDIHSTLQVQLEQPSTSGSTSSLAAQVSPCSFNSSSIRQNQTEISSSNKSAAAAAPVNAILTSQRSERSLQNKDMCKVRVACSSKTCTQHKQAMFVSSLNQQLQLQLQQGSYVYQAASV
jgi:hypothetical protein